MKSLKNLAPTTARSTLAATAVLLALTPGAHAAGPYDQDFCGHPVQAICASLSATDVGRDQRRNQLLERTQTQAWFNTVEKLHLNPLLSLKQLPTLSPWDQIRIRTTYLAKFNEILKIEIGIAEYVAVWGQIDHVKKYLLAAIDAQIPAAQNLVLNAAMKYEVNHTVPLDSRKIDAMIAENHVDGPDLKVAYHENCGRDGMIDQAIAIPLGQRPNTRKYLLVCPGLILGAQGSGMNSEANFSNMVKVLGHEWGHHIDVAYFGQTYENFLQCLATNTVDGLVDPRGSLGAKDIAPAIINLANPVERKIVSHAREIIADFWGNQTMVQFLKSSLFAPLDFAGRLEFLRNSNAFFCGAQDEGIHPNGEYRLGITLRTDPGIAAALGCTRPAGPFGAVGAALARPACTLNGAQQP